MCCQMHNKIIAFFTVLSQSSHQCSHTVTAEMFYGIFVVLHEGVQPSDDSEGVRIILEGVMVMDELRNVPFVVVMLPARLYALNLSYPPELKYTSEALQKIIMEIEGNKLSATVQTLKTLLPC